MRTPIRRLALAAMATLFLSGAVLALGSGGAASDAPRRELFKDSRALVAMARVNGDREVSLLIAARPGRTESVARQVQKLGGRIRVRVDEVGYLRARVPIDFVEEIVAFEGVQSADVDQDASGIPPYMQPGITHADPERRLPLASGPGGDWPPNRVDLTLRPIYSPLKDLGAQEWRGAHPTFDGRGVTVAVLDGNVDILLPELQVATTLDGKPTRKVIDVINSMDPLEPEADFPHWVSMRDRVTAKGGKVTYAGEVYTAPHDGTFAIGIFDLCRFASYVQAYFRTVLDRPGLATSVDKQIGVLWDEASGDVWVDTNQDRSFADESPVRDFRERYDYALLGQDDPDTAVRETIPLVVQTAKADRFIAVNPAMYGHSTMVTGAVVASRGENGRFNGVAPGARVVSLFEGSTTHGMVEGLIRAFQDPRVDVVLLEQNVWIAMPYVLGDGRFTVTVICSRLIEKHKKPFLSPANNAPGLNTVEEHGMARWGFGVGAYESRENFLANRAIHVFEEDNAHWVGSWGPSGNGALQPDIMSPSEVVTTYPASRSADDEGLKGVFGFPPGYAMCGGTSCATPVAAGSLSLLISGAKQSGLRWDPESLYRSVTSTGRWLSNMPVYRQGNGLIQVGAAWDALEKIGRHGSARPMEVEVRGPVRTAVSGWLEPPDTGPGLYEREGWAAGDRGERTILLTRRSGPSASATVRLRWIGNDGTFTSAETIALPLGKAVPLSVSIAPATTGAHSALLSIEEPGGRVPATRLMAVVVAAERFDAAGKYQVSREVRTARPGTSELFFDVPPGVDAVKFELQAPKETVRMSVYPPDSREDTVYQMPQEDRQVRTIGDPPPGVWAVVMHDMRDAFKFDESRPTTLPRTPVTVTASLVGVAMESPNTASLSSAGFQALSLSARNRLSEFQGRIESHSLASVREISETLSPRRQRVVEIAVPKGVERLMVQVDGVTPASSDLDLYLFDCTGKSCQPKRARVGGNAQEALSLDAPAPGLWKAVVDAARAPGAVSFRYRDYFFDPALGSIVVADGSAARESGATWSAPASVWIAGKATEGRQLCGIVAAAGEGIAGARFATSLDFGAADAIPKIGHDAILLGLATIRLESASPAATGGDR